VLRKYYLFDSSAWGKPETAQTLRVESQCGPDHASTIITTR